MNSDGSNPKLLTPLTKPTAVEPLVPIVREVLLALAGTCMQPTLTMAHVPTASLAHAQLLAFYGTTAQDLKDLDPLAYCAYIDYLLSAVGTANDGVLLQFFDFIGKPMSPEEFTAWFFGRG